MGFIEETGAAQFYRDARITSIYEGTNGIQANDLVGRKIGRENGESIRGLIADMRRDIMALEISDDTSSHVQKRVLGAIDDLEKATDWIVSTWGQDPGSVAASAVPFLKLFGVTSGGWLMAKAHDLAMRMDDRAFRASKLSTTRFFIDHHVVETSTSGQGCDNRFSGSSKCRLSCLIRCKNLPLALDSSHLFYHFVRSVFWVRTRMNGFSRYVFQQLFVGMVFVTICFTCIIWLSQSLRLVELIVNRGVSAGTFVYLTLLMLPNFLPVILPIALFCVVVFVYAKLIMDRELVVMRASGLGQMAIAKPALVLAVLVVGVGYFLNLYLIPESYRMFRQMQWDIRYNYSHILLKAGSV